MSESLSSSINMASQAVALALISRIRWRCFPDAETGRCTMVSGCTEAQLVPSADSIDCQEFVVGNDQKFSWFRVKASLILNESDISLTLQTIVH